MTVQGAASGEAFIQMDSEKSAESTAVTKNKKLMFVGGLRRYVEVIQCSGDEMALVLQQGLPTPGPPPATAVPQSSSALAAVSGAVLPTPGFWSLPPPNAQTTDLTLLLHQSNTIPLHSAPGTAARPTGLMSPCSLYVFFIFTRHSCTGRYC